MVEKLEKVGKGGEKLEKVGKGGENGEKWGKVMKSWGKVVKSGEKWRKLGKIGEKVGKSREKVGKVGKRAFFKFWTKWPPFWMSENNFRSQFLPFQIDTQLFFFLNFFDKMAAGGHFGLDDNVSYRTRPRYLDE